MVRGDHGQSVFQGGHAACLPDSPVHLYRLVQGLLGFAFMVPVVDPASFHQQEEAFGVLPQDLDGHHHHLGE